MNTIMRSIGGAIGGQIAASVLASSLAAGTSTDHAFTLGFAASAVALALPFGASLLIPRRRHDPHAAAPAPAPA